MSAYPIAYEQFPPLQRSRLTVFFRFLLVIPHWIWGVFYGIGAFVVVFLAWFAVLFTGRYPQGMYDFVAGYMRFITRLYAYSLLIVDVYPPFDGGEYPEYPVRVNIPLPQESYSRLATFFRGILLIPIWIVQYVFEVWILLLSLAIWVVSVIMGSTPAGMLEGMRLPVTYYVRSTAYSYLLTDRYPPLNPD